MKFNLLRRCLRRCWNEKKVDLKTCESGEGTDENSGNSLLQFIATISGKY